MALGIVPGWCPCGARTQLVLGFEGWVRVCGGCGGYAQQIAAARMREETERQYNPPSSIRIPKIISGFRRGSKDSSKNKNRQEAGERR